MLLSQYCLIMRPFIEEALFEIVAHGSHRSKWNDKGYYCQISYLDDVVEQIVKCNSNIEKDIDYAEAFRLAGVVQGYLTATDIMGKVIKDQNPLKSLFSKTGG